MPTSMRELKSFLGLASYYQRFVPGFSKIANPLFALTHKDFSFVWNQKCEDAFNQLKSLLTNAPLLVFPNFKKEFILETDASGLGLGAVLAQQQDNGSVASIAYASRTLQPHEKNYGVTELEALGVVWAVKHFRPYLYGHKCHVVTDHEALKSLLNTPHPSGKLARWGLAIQELDLQIHYRPRRVNQAADTLSRFPLQTLLLENRRGTVQTEVITPPIVQAKDGEARVNQVNVISSNAADMMAEYQDADQTSKH